MRLDKLTPPHLSDAAQPAAQMAGTEVRGLTADSRAVQPGYLFAALSGSMSDGRDYVSQAIENGAAAILTDRPMVTSVPVLTSNNPRQDLAMMAARFFEHQPPYIAAITGTNGKTSSAAFLRQILASAGHKAAAMGTLGVEAEGFFETLDHTTPEPVRLHAALRDLVAHRVTHLAMEASSHGLAQYRLDGVRPMVVGFTNLTRDHMDYHASPEDYAAAKQRLLTEVLAENGTAVIIMTHEIGAAMAQAAQEAGRRVLEIGREGDSVHVAIEHRSTTGLRLAVTLNGQTQSLSVPLIGDFQTENLALALGLAQAFGLDDEVLFGACRMLHAPRGRMQFIGHTASGAAVYVDYAHTPDALANALDALRAHVPQGGMLAVMFGCGGNRDVGKRPQMGAIADDKADRIYVTDDNPRREDAAAIRAAIMAACPKATQIEERKLAIETALDAAAANDIVLLAGKGHETGQIIGDTILPFDDAKIAALHMAAKGGHHA
jgi:UDP-N-acetylmuramoyl-L-alanyl-D-glutamate--2,6-diaminopimelate ligase